MLEWAGVYFLSNMVRTSVLGNLRISCGIIKALACWTKKAIFLEVARERPANQCPTRFRPADLVCEPGSSHAVYPRGRRAMRRRGRPLQMWQIPFVHPKFLFPVSPPLTRPAPPLIKYVSCLWGTARFLQLKTLPCWVSEPSSLIHFSFCLDIDECDLGNHTCDTMEHGYCFNVKKLLAKDLGYECVCESGYTKVGSACVKRGEGITMCLFRLFSEKRVSWKNIKEMTKMQAAFPARLFFVFRPTVWMFLT